MQFIYDLLSWQYFGILAIIWIIIDLGWMGRWRGLLIRLNQLIKKPWVFATDPEPDVPPLYPRPFLEQLAQWKRGQDGGKDGGKGTTQTNLPKAIQRLVDWWDNIGEDVLSKGKGIIAFGSVVCFLLLLYFILSDAVTIVQTLALMGIDTSIFPDALNTLMIPTLGGTILAAIVGIWMLVELKGIGHLIDVSVYNASQKKILSYISGIVIAFVIIVSFGLVWERLIDMGRLQSSPTTYIILGWVNFGLLLLCNTISAAIVWQPGINGIGVIAYLIVGALYVIKPAVAFLLDVVWRIVYVAVDLIAWLLLSPLLVIPSLFYHWFGPKPTPESAKK